MVLAMSITELLFRTLGARTGSMPPAADARTLTGIAAASHVLPATQDKV